MKSTGGPFRCGQNRVLGLVGNQMMPLPVDVAAGARLF